MRLPKLALSFFFMLLVFLPLARAQFNPTIDPPILAETGPGIGGARISWATSHPATARVEYGADENLGQSTPLDSELRFRHEEHIAWPDGQVLFFRVIATLDHPETGEPIELRSGIRTVTIGSLPKPSIFYFPPGGELGPYVNFMNGAVTEAHWSKTQDLFFRDQNHLIKSARIGIGPGETARAWEDDLPVEERMLQFDEQGNPHLVFGRTDKLLDKILEIFEEPPYITVMGIPLSLAERAISRGRVSINNGDTVVRGAGTNWMQHEDQIEGSIHLIHFGSASGGDGGDPFNRFHYITDVVSDTELHIEYPYTGDTKGNIEYIIIPSNIANGVRSSVTDFELYSWIMEGLANHLWDRYGAIIGESDFSFWNEPDLNEQEWYWDDSGQPHWEDLAAFYDVTREAFLRAFRAHGQNEISMGFADFAWQNTDGPEGILAALPPGQRTNIYSWHMYDWTRFFHITMFEAFQDQFGWGPDALGNIFANHDHDWLATKRIMGEFAASPWYQMQLLATDYSATHFAFSQNHFFHLADRDPRKRIDKVYYFTVGHGNLFLSQHSYFDGPHAWEKDQEIYFRRPAFNALRMVDKMHGTRIQDRKISGGHPYTYATGVRDEENGIFNVLLGHYKAEDWYDLDDGNSNTLTDPSALRSEYRVVLGVPPQGVVQTKLYQLRKPYAFWRDHGRKGDPNGPNPEDLTPAEIQELKDKDDIYVSRIPGAQREFRVKPNSVVLVQYLSQKNQAPEARMAARQIPDVDQPLRVRLYDQSLDVDGMVVSRQWDFGDGSPVSHDEGVFHTYELPGTYTITLTVTDDEGATSSVTENLEVQILPGQRLVRDNTPMNSSHFRITDEDPIVNWQYITYAGVDGDATRAFNGQRMTLRWYPDVWQCGRYQVEFFANDYNQEATYDITVRIGGRLETDTYQNPEMSPAWIDLGEHYLCPGFEDFILLQNRRGQWTHGDAIRMTYLGDSGGEDGGNENE